MVDFTIYIEPHERYEALEAYEKWLSPKQIQEIKDADETAIIQIRIMAERTTVLIIPEG